jgi:hypothetical protein
MPAGGYRDPGSGDGSLGLFPAARIPAIPAGMLGAELSYFYAIRWRKVTSTD